MGKFANRFLRGWDFDEIFGSLDIQSLNYILYDEHSKVTRTTKVHYKILPTSITIGQFFEFNENIETMCIYRNGKPTDRAFHAFVVIKTAEHYYSMERFPECISIQRSKKLKDVTKLHGGQTRGKFIARETDWVEGKGTVLDILTFLMKNKMFQKKYHVLFENCQMFCSLVFNKWNIKGMKFQMYRPKMTGPLKAAIKKETAV